MTTPAISNQQAADYAEYVLPLTSQFFGAFFKLAAVQPGERVLDLACGPGETTIEAALRAGRAARSSASISRANSRRWRSAARPRRVCVRCASRRSTPAI